MSARHYLLGGKVILHQDDVAGGHRAGLDAVMLAASVAGDAGHVVDLGAGVGSAGLCVAARLAHVRVTLVENSAATLALARKTLADPENAAFADRVRLLDADVALRGRERGDAGLVANMADYAIMNPPYWQKGQVRLSANDSRVAAHVLGEEGLAPWFRTAAAILRKGGRLSVIFPAQRLDSVLREMAGRFGGVAIHPLYKGANEEAGRVVVTGVKASRAPMRLMPGLVLHEERIDGAARRQWTARANAILKGEAALFI